MRKNLIGSLVALSGLFIEVIIFKHLITNVNNTTVALCFLLIVQITASISGLLPAIIASVVSVLCFNYFFLPPIGTFTIEDPQNWLAFAAFLITATITSQLSSSARARAQDAERRQKELGKLFELGRAIIAIQDYQTATSSIAKQVTEIFNLDYCAIFVPNEGGKLSQLVLTNGSTPALHEAVLPTDIEKVFKSGELRLATQPQQRNQSKENIDTITFAPLKVGPRATGVIALSAIELGQAAIEAIASLVALALERARFLQEVSNTEALRQSDKLKSALLASVSHNLRTPLTAIRTSIDSLLREDLVYDPATLREFHLIISEEAFRLTRIVENILEMARIEAGELNLLKRWSSLAELFNNTLDRCATVLREHRIKVDLDDQLPVVKIDSQMLAEVLTNLLENAAKYSPPTSEITLSARVVDNQLTISVRDQGAGIAPDEIEQIFAKFYRGKNEKVKRTSGTGMGLAISRGIIEAHGGKIWAENSPDHGARFQFSLPVECKDIAEFIPAEEL